jgi:hypothetical protein
VTNQSEAPKSRFRAFWTSLPGIVTAIAALITAVGGIIALVVVPGSSNNGPTHAGFVRRADSLCSQTADLLRQLPPVSSADPATAAKELPVVAQRVRDLADKLRALNAPPEDLPTLAHFTELLDTGANQADMATVSLQQRDLTGVRSHLGLSVKALQDSRNAANALGASACAQNPIQTGPFG